MKSWLALLLAALVSPTWAARFDCSLSPPPEREQDRLLWTYTELLSSGEEEQINERLHQFARETSNRILVLVVDTLCGLDASDLAFEVGERWGIGARDQDNGIVILIKPNGPSNQRKIFIATGYGLEGAIPDATCKQIVEDEIIPRFKEGRFADGINAGLDVLMGLAKGEFNAKSYGKKPFPWSVLIIAAIFLVVGLFSWRGRVNRYARTNKVDWWTAMWLLSQMNNRQSGRWTSSGGGFRGFGGGGGGGGFGGFGGGSFGGGGAGGSW